MKYTVVATLSTYSADDSLPGRRWLAGDGIVEVTDRRSPGGMYYVRRSDGREQAIRPEYIRAALAENEVPQ